MPSDFTGISTYGISGKRLESNLQPAQFSRPTIMRSVRMSVIKRRTRSSRVKRYYALFTTDAVVIHCVPPRWTRTIFRNDCFGCGTACNTVVVHCVPPRWTRTIFNNSGLGCRSRDAHITGCIIASWAGSYFLNWHYWIHIFMFFVFNILSENSG